MEQKSALPAFGNGYRLYVLFVLTLTYTFSVIDRNIVNILIDDIGADFGINGTPMEDTVKGFLMGPVFAIFYAVLGIPMARLADRTVRKNVVAVAITFWSTATALCGMAINVWTFAIARIGVAVGEAGASPPAHSIISDYFKKSELSRALAVYSLGATLGSAFGHLFGGTLGEAFGWRSAFFIVAVPGIIIGMMLAMTVKEPKRGQTTENFDEAAERVSFGETVKRLFANRLYVGSVAAHVFAVMVAYGVVVWVARVYGRTFELGNHEVGVHLSIATLLGGVPGMLLGGTVTDWFAKRDERWMGWLPAIFMVVAFPILVVAPLADTQWLMLTLVIVGLFFFSLAWSPAFAIMQGNVSPADRSVAAGFSFFFTNMLGLGLTPFIIGILSDVLKPSVGSVSLNYALSIICGLCVFSAASFWWTAREIGRKPDFHKA